jgi:hypothetical protein
MHPAEAGSCGLGREARPVGGRLVVERDVQCLSAFPVAREPGTLHGLNLEQLDGSRRRRSDRREHSSRNGYEDPDLGSPDQLCAAEDNAGQELDGIDGFAAFGQLRERRTPRVRLLHGQPLAITRRG